MPSARETAPFTALLVLLSIAPIEADEAWVRHTIDDSSRGADGVRLADVDGDNDLDIATGWEEGGRVRVYLNPGPRKATEKWPAVTVGNVKSAEDAVFADLDGDGAMDVISCCEGRTRTVFVHWAPREKERYLDETAWKTEAIPHSEDFAMWMFCMPMQIDGKRGVDLVVGSKGAGAAVGWYESPENPRDLAAWKWHHMTDAGWIMSIQAADLEHDGRADVLFSDRKGKGRGVWYLGVPREKLIGGVEDWPRTRIGRVDQEVMFLARGSIREGKPDDVVVAVRGGGLQWIRREPQRTWGAVEIPLPPNTGTGKGVAIADVNLDGRSDLVFTCENAGGKHGAMWLEQTVDDGVSEWRPHPVSGTKQGVKFDRIEMIDLDGDGDLDLLTCEERDNLGVIWYENPTKSAAD